MKRWDQARVANRLPHKQSKVGPVGAAVGMLVHEEVCPWCGYHRCSPRCLEARAKSQTAMLGVDFGTKPETVGYHQVPEQKALGSLRACPTCGWDTPKPWMVLDCGNAPDSHLAPEHIAHRDARKRELAIAQHSRVGLEKAQQATIAPNALKAGELLRIGASGTVGLAESYPGWITTRRPNGLICWAHQSGAEVDRPHGVSYRTLTAVDETGDCMYKDTLEEAMCAALQIMIVPCINGWVFGGKAYPTALDAARAALMAGA